MSGVQPDAKNVFDRCVNSALRGGSGRLIHQAMAGEPAHNNSTGNATINANGAVTTIPSRRARSQLQALSTLIRKKRRDQYAYSCTSAGSARARLHGRDSIQEARGE